MSASTVSHLIGAVSFEERCIVGPREHIANGGDASTVHMVRLIGSSPQLKSNLETITSLDLPEPIRTDRFSSKSIWDWVWSVVVNVQGEVIIDATCLPREALGMILFALSVVRERIDSVKVHYVSAPPTPKGYATQNESLPESDRWLSKGVASIRSILGFPGDFASEKRRHLIALAGHEFDRLLEIIVSYEPDRLSLSSEQADSSTVQGAGKRSKKVENDLRQEKKIALPFIEEVQFSASSISETFESLSKFSVDFQKENVALAAMNTKLSFIGAALFALHRREIRMVYAVPELYNPLYCLGIGELTKFDITSLLKSAETPTLHQARLAKV